MADAKIIGGGVGLFVLGALSGWCITSFTSDNRAVAAYDSDLNYYEKALQDRLRRDPSKEAVSPQSLAALIAADLALRGDKLAVYIEDLTQTGKKAILHATDRDARHKLRKTQVKLAKEACNQAAQIHELLSSFSDNIEKEYKQLADLPDRVDRILRDQENYINGNEANLEYLRKQHEVHYNNQKCVAEVGHHPDQAAWLKRCEDQHAAALARLNQMTTFSPTELAATATSMSYNEEFVGNESSVMYASANTFRYEILKSRVVMATKLVEYCQYLDKDSGATDASNSNCFHMYGYGDSSDDDDNHEAPYDEAKYAWLDDINNANGTDPAKECDLNKTGCSANGAKHAIWALHTLSSGASDTCTARRDINEIVQDFKCKPHTNWSEKQPDIKADINSLQCEPPQAQGITMMHNVIRCAHGRTRDIVWDKYSAYFAQRSAEKMCETKFEADLSREEMATLIEETGGDRCGHTINTFAQSSIYTVSPHHDAAFLIKMLYNNQMGNLDLNGDIWRWSARTDGKPDTFKGFEKTLNVIYNDITSLGCAVKSCDDKHMAASCFYKHGPLSLLPYVRRKDYSTSENVVDANDTTAMGLMNHANVKYPRLRRMEQCGLTANPLECGNYMNHQNFPHDEVSCVLMANYKEDIFKACDAPSPTTTPQGKQTFQGI